MGKIEDLLMAEEHVVKKQGNVQLAIGEPRVPAGDLYLTDNRLIFLVSKELGSVYFRSWHRRQRPNLSLQCIKSVNKGALGCLRAFL